MEHPTNNKKKEVSLDWSILHRNCLLKRVTEGKIEGRTELSGR